MITLCKTLFRPHLKSSGAEYVILGEKKKKKDNEERFNNI